MSTDGGDAGSGPRAAWLHAPRTRSARSRDDLARRRAGLEAALRAAHGASVRFRLVSGGGAEEALRLEVDDLGSERWVERALLPVYGSADWRRTTPPPPTLGWSRWSGWRSGFPGEQVGEAPEPGRVLGALQAALRTGTRGGAVELHLRPAPTPSLSLLDVLWPPLRRSGLSERPVRRAEPIPPQQGPAGPGLLWSAAIDLRWAPARPGVTWGPDLSAVSSAWTALDGRPLHLREVPRDRAPSFRSLLGLGELLSLLPSDDLVGREPADPTASRNGIPLGRTADGAVVRLPVEDYQGRHFAALGETGMGKSSLLVTVAVRAARRGGVIVLDPLGETAASIRDELVAGGRAVRWVAPGASGAGTNALAGIAEALRSDPVRAERELAALVHALRRVRAGRYTDAAYWGPRLEEMLARAVRASALLPDGTLEDAHALLASAGTGRTVVPPEALTEVRELAARVHARPDDAEGARRLLYEIVRNPTLVRMLCARPSPLSLADLVADGQVALVSGEAAAVGESTARYLLAAYLALIWSELLSHGRAGKTFVLLDEAQWFAHDGLAEMLRLARRRNVHVGVATQSLASLPAEVREALGTNVADLVVFRGSPEEARELGRWAPGVTAEGLLGLPRGEAAVLLGKGESVRWVRTARLPTARPGARSARVEPFPRAEPPVPAAPAPPAAADGGLGPAWEELAAQARVLAPGELLEVDLADWQRRGLADDAGLRALGGELGRCGAIVDRVRTDHGRLWRLDPHRLTARRSGRTALGSPGAADSPQRL